MYRNNDKLAKITNDVLKYVFSKFLDDKEKLNLMLTNSKYRKLFATQLKQRRLLLSFTRTNIPNRQWPIKCFGFCGEETILCGNEKALEVWNTRTKTPVTFPASKYEALFESRGKIFFRSPNPGDCEMHVYNVTTRDFTIIKPEFENQFLYTYKCIYDGKDYIFFMDKDRYTNNISLWNSQKNKCIIEHLKKLSFKIHRMIHTMNKIVLVDEGGSIYILDESGLSKSCNALNKLREISKICAFNKEYFIILSLDRKIIHIRSLEDGRLIKRLTDDGIYNYKFCSIEAFNHNFATLNNHGRIHIWNEHGCIRALKCQNTVSCMIIYKKTLLIAGYSNGDIKIWDVNNTNHLRIWDVNTTNLLKILSMPGEHKSKVCSLSASPFGVIISGHEDGSINIWKQAHLSKKPYSTPTHTTSRDTFNNLWTYMTVYAELLLGLEIDNHRGFDGPKIPEFIIIVRGELFKQLEDIREKFVKINNDRAKKEKKDILLNELVKETFEKLRAIKSEYNEERKKTHVKKTKILRFKCCTIIDEFFSEVKSICLKHSLFVVNCQLPD